jgi:pSer/pThr/pTyr-binding forkhead associated (FHA) protein
VDKAVSRRHAQLRQVAGRWVVRDLQSDNGTFVSYQGDPAQERQVIGGNENAIKNNSVVRFGPASFTLLTNP